MFFLIDVWDTDKKRIAQVSDAFKPIMIWHVKSSQQGVGKQFNVSLAFETKGLKSP